MCTKGAFLNDKTQTMSLERWKISLAEGWEGNSGERDDKIKYSNMLK
jgi:hypothetical protein